MVQEYLSISTYVVYTYIKLYHLKMLLKLNNYTEDTPPHILHTPHILHITHTHHTHTPGQWLPSVQAWDEMV